MTDPARAPSSSQTEPSTLPAPAYPAHLVTEAGTPLIAGLTWEIASGPETPVVQPNAPLVLRLPTRRATLKARLNPARFDGSYGTGPTSLLLAMANDLTRQVPEASGTWVFIGVYLTDPPNSGEATETTPSEGALWIGVADLAPAEDDRDKRTAILPRPGPEQVFADPDDALDALRTHLTITEIAGIAARWSDHKGQAPALDARTCRSRITQGLAHLAPTLPIQEVDVDPDALPVFTKPRRVPVKALAIGSTALAGIAILAVTLPTLIAAALQPPPPPPPELIPVALEQEAFATACTGALTEWWPRSIGWQVAESGCALAGSLPAHLPRPTARSGQLVDHMTVWQGFVPEPGRNSVLGLSAADQMMQSWPHDARLEAQGTRLTLWKTIPLPLVPVQTVEGSPVDPAFDPEQAHARLAALWAETPDAVRRPGAPNADRAGFIIAARSETPPETLFTRAAQVPGIAPVRYVRTRTDAELVLKPYAPRRVPVTLINQAGGPSQAGTSQ